MKKSILLLLSAILFLTVFYISNQLNINGSIMNSNLVILVGCSFVFIVMYKLFNIPDNYNELRQEVRFGILWIKKESILNYFILFLLTTTSISFIIYFYDKILSGLLL